MKYAIETFDLTKKYGDFLAVNELNMKIKNKSIYGFLGPNGAGKTTTIKMLTCLIRPTKGTASVAGYDIQKESNEVRKKIGMVPQLVSLYGDLTAKENTQLCADYYGIPKEEQEDKINDLMELVDIKYAENKLVKHMSGGQKQKVSVVASLVHKPDILFLDEPTIGLDPSTKQVLWQLIRDLNDNGHTIILCSHDMYEVELLCENVGIINQGVLAAFDTPQGLKDSVMLEEEQEKQNRLENIITKIQNNELNSKEDIDLKSKLKLIQDENTPTKELRVMIDNLDDNILNSIEKNKYVESFNQYHSGRIIINIKENEEECISDVLKTIISSGGIISSINTSDPSLEDVFVKVTSKTKEDPIEEENS